MVEYELFENIVNRNIATALNISFEQLIETYGGFNSYIPDSTSEIMSVLYHGWHNQQYEKEAEQLVNKVVIVDLEESTLDEEDYLYLQHESNLADMLLKDLHEHGYTEIEQVYLK